MLNQLLKWLSWFFAASGILMIIIGTIAYIFQNAHILGARWGTYFTFAEPFLYCAIVLILINIACKMNCGDK